MLESNKHKVAKKTMYYGLAIGFVIVAGAPFLILIKTQQ